MATIEGLTKARMLEIEDATIVDADTSSGHIILTRKDGNEIDGGSVGTGGGEDGESAYQVAVDNGFTGTVTEWLASLKGDPGDPGSGSLPGSYHLGGTAGPLLLPSDFRDGLDLRDFIDTGAGLVLRPDSTGNGTDATATDHMPIFKAAWAALIAQGRGRLRIPFLGSQYRGNTSDGANPLTGIYRLKAPATGTNFLPAFDFDNLTDVIDIDFDSSGIYTGPTDWGWCRDTPQAWNDPTYYSNVAAAVIRAYNSSSGLFLRLRNFHLRGPDTATASGAYARNPKMYDSGLIMQGLVLTGRCEVENAVIEGMHAGVNAFGDHIRFKRVNALNNTLNWWHDLAENQKDNVFDTCFGSRARLACRGFHPYMVRDTNSSWEHAHFGNAPYDRFRARHSMPRNDGVFDSSGNFTSPGTNLHGAKPSAGCNWEQQLQVGDWIWILDQLATHTGPSGASMFGFKYVVTSISGAGNVVALSPEAGSPAIVNLADKLVFAMQKSPSNVKGTTLEQWIVGSEESDLTSENAGNAHIWDDAEVPVSVIDGQKMDSPTYSGIDDLNQMPLSLADPTTPAYSGVAGSLSPGTASQFQSAGAGFVSSVAVDSWLEIKGLQITAIDGTGVITTALAHHLAAGDSIYVVIPGVSTKSWFVSNNTDLGPTTLALTPTQNGATKVNPGAFATGAYLARMTRQPIQIASITPGNPTIINLTKRQALVTADRVTLGGITGTIGDLLNGQSLAVTYINATQISVPPNSTGLSGGGGYAYRDSARGFFDTLRYFRITGVPDSSHLTLECDPQISEIGLAWQVVYRPRMHARIGQLRECTMPHQMGTDTWWGGENVINCQDPPFACDIYFQEPILPAAKTFLDDADPPGTLGGVPFVIQVVNYNDPMMNQLRSVSRRGDGEYILARPLPGTIAHRGELVSVTGDVANGLLGVHTFDPADGSCLGAVVLPGGPGSTLVWVGSRGNIPHVRFPWAVTTPGPNIVSDAIAKGMAKEQGDQLSGLIGYRNDIPVNGMAAVFLYGTPEQVANVREMLGQFGMTTTLAGSTSTDLPIMGGSNANQKFVVCMRSGFITGLTLNLFPLATAGQAIATVNKNGVATALTAQIGPGTWPQAKVATAAVGAIPFKAGDILTVTVVTAGLSTLSYATAGIEVGY